MTKAKDDTPPGDGIDNPVLVVFRLMLEGHPESDILEFLETHDITGKESAAAFELAIKNFVEAGNVPDEFRYGWCLEAGREVYRRLLATGDYAGALRAVVEIAKLSGVTPTPGKRKKAPGTETSPAGSETWMKDLKALTSQRAQ